MTTATVFIYDETEPNVIPKEFPIQLSEGEGHRFGLKQTILIFDALCDHEGTEKGVTEQKDGVLILSGVRSGHCDYRIFWHPTIPEKGRIAAQAYLLLKSAKRLLD